MSNQVELISPKQAEELCREITANLPEYFGLSECNEHYAQSVGRCVNFAAKIDGRCIGLLSLDFPYPANANIYWMGIMREYQRLGIGHLLIQEAVLYAKMQGANTMTVETLAPTESDKNYLKTYKFYVAQGFKPLFNLKPREYEWNMVYMVKYLRRIHSNIYGAKVVIRSLIETDIPIILTSFSIENWPKPESIFKQYLQEQREGSRLIWVAYEKETFAGYITLKWQSQYEPFRKGKIPEIMDLNVLPPFRNRGIGSRLLDIAELEASQKSDIIGIGVGLYKDYGAAQKLYIERGYIPDGCGVTYNYKLVVPGTNVSLDDDLVLWLTKNLK